MIFNSNELELSYINSKYQSDKELDFILAIILNKIFCNPKLLKNNPCIDINQILIQLIDTIKISNVNNHSSFLNDSLFSMIYNLTREKIQSNKYIDLCILNDIADNLIEFLGRLNQINTVN